MDESISRLPAEPESAFELGEILGRRWAFSSIAGRCSAADVACIRRMRDEKIYLARAPTWEEFCPKYLGMSKTAANRLVSLLEELGQGYFKLTQLTRVSLTEYRSAIAPAVSDAAITVNGEAIALTEENAPEITQAVAELCRTAAVRTPPEVNRLDVLDKRCRKLLEEFEELAESGPGGDDRDRLLSSLSAARLTLERIEERMRA